MSQPSQILFASRVGANVRDYGAVGDGVADDTAAIQAAIAACPVGQSVYFPSPPVGYLAIGSGTEIFLVTKNVNLLGDHGARSAIIVPASVGSSRDVFRIAVQGVNYFQRIEHLSIKPICVPTTVTLTGVPTGGTFVLSINVYGVISSTAIAFNASASAFLTSLPAYVSEIVSSVTGGSGSPWVINWVAGSAPLPLTLTTNSLTGGSSPSVTITGGSLTAQNALTIDVTNAGCYQSNMHIDGCFFGSTSGYSIGLINPTNNDGFFCSQIVNNLIFSGLSLIRSGDSNVISGNLFPFYLGGFGNSSGRTAITLSLVAGAARNIIKNNNSSTPGGFFVGLAGDHTTIEGNQIEAGNGTINAYSALIALSGATATMTGTRIIGNSLNAHGNANYDILVDHAANTFIADNVLGGGSGGGGGVVNGLNITANALNTFVGANPNTNPPAIPIADLGSATTYLGTWNNAVLGPIVNSNTTLTGTAIGKVVIGYGNTSFALVIPSAVTYKYQLIHLQMDAAAAALMTVTAVSGFIGGQASRIMMKGESVVLWSNGLDWVKFAGSSTAATCRMSCTTSPSIPNSAVTVVPMDTTVLDNTGKMGDLTNKRISIWRPGLYRVYGQLAFATVGGTAFAADIFVNGAFMAAGTQSSVAAGFPSPTVQAILQLSAGDYIDLRALQISGGSVPISTYTPSPDYLEASEIIQW